MKNVLSYKTFPSQCLEKEIIFDVNRSVTN